MRAFSWHQKLEGLLVALLRQAYLVYQSSLSGTVSLVGNSLWSSIVEQVFWVLLQDLLVCACVHLDLL